MAIRKISDLPFLTEDQKDMRNDQSLENFNKSSFELSYLSSETGDAANICQTYVSRQMKMSDFKDLLTYDIRQGDITLSGTKYFSNGVWTNVLSADKINLNGDFLCNEKNPINDYDAVLNFGNVSIQADSITLKPSARVSNVISTDNDSIVNVKFLKDYANLYFNEALDDILSRLNAKIAEFDDLINSMKIDYGKVWPVGSLFITTQTSSTCPIAALKSNWTWQKIEGRYLLASGRLISGAETENYSAGENIAPGLPSHTHKYSKSTGSSDRGGDSKGIGGYNISTSTTAVSDDIYGKSTSVRPPAFVVDVWKRTN